ncbi:phosphonate metabolism protein PhnM [Mesobacillus foraminis]|uniref:Alpha-D-ribose 1-methylphosphonate 5-triphosphate diphosphatase n=1 Tax=Mesobacillus foraminis TaxID=279826 RepID=A0A4V6NKM0_9BACI|nr:phosphonate metabolism protein PhnM [Mesobacillus foraminis]TCN21210.1 alpha-D-ribose 1-methylphosphonate 5-triphosphate diphosphatase [Mesobacillus foraminis]
MFVITNGKLITKDVILQGYDLLIEGDRIARIAPKGEIKFTEEMEIIDAEGGYVSPGFIDIHSDYIEHMAAPRPTSLMNFELSLRETEKELISHGITTMFHSLSLYKATEYAYKPIREPENVRKLIDLIQQTHQMKHLVRHRFHARFEIDNVDEINNLKQYIAEKKVHLVSFMDHTPGQGQYRHLEIYRNTVKSYNNISDSSIDVLIRNHQTKEKLSIEDMKEIAQLAHDHNIGVASHDDDSLGKLELVHGFGTTISEFPITLEVAHRAKQLGMYTIAGAPNVLLGGSHSGNLCATEAIQNDCIDILCSDYYPASMLHSIFELAKNHEMDLAEMVKLVTINPAKAVKMDHDIGSIEEGKKADLLIIEKLSDDFPVITSVFVDGKLIQKTNYRI